MAKGNGHGPELRRANSETAVGQRLGFGNCMRMLGRKRIVVSHCLDPLSFSPAPTTPPRKRSAVESSSKKSHMEALPPDVLVKILSCVDHDDLKQLYHVSKSVREAALIAEKSHFAFSTPSSKTACIMSFRNLEDADAYEDAPNAPRQRRHRSRFSAAGLAGISIALFPPLGQQEAQKEHPVPEFQQS